MVPFLCNMMLTSIRPFYANTMLTVLVLVLFEYMCNSEQTNGGDVEFRIANV